MPTRFFLIIVSVLFSFSGNSTGTLPVSKNTLNTLNMQVQAKVKPEAVEQSWHFTKSDIQSLIKIQVNEKVSIGGFPESIQATKSAAQSPTTKTIELTRYSIMAAGAKIVEITTAGKRTIPFPELMTLSAPEHGVGLVLNPITGDVSGITNHLGITMTISGNIQTGLDFRTNDEGMPMDQVSQQCLTSLADQPGNPLADLKSDLMSKSLSINSGGVDYETIIAVDTDNEWMAGKSNNTTVAMNFIASLFTNMNVFYEQDLSLRLLIGDVTLRTAPDPYPNRPNAFDSLNDVGEYWRTNNEAIARDFVVMLSGQNISNFSFSGIAWINQYCENGFLQAGGSQTVGSYSVNRIGANLTTGFTAQFLAHEIGHNLGSPHTHCYLPAVDECYNAEPGCFSGSVSCPAGGSGTIMSYCHFGSPDGADCGLNNEEFHPSVITLLDARIISNFPSCIQAVGSDIIFFNGFE